MDSTWSDAKKWRMDLLKNAISFTIAAVVSLFIIDEIQATRASAKAKADAYYSVRIKALDEFRSAAVAYDLAANTAYTELYQWSSKQKTPAMFRYEQDAYPKWVLSVETIEQLFPGTLPKIQTLTAKSGSRHRVYDILVDKRLDGAEKTAIDPWATRRNFDQLSVELVAARAELVAELQKALFPPSPSK